MPSRPTAFASWYNPVKEFKMKHGRGVLLVMALLGMGSSQALDFDDLAKEGEIRFLAERPDPGAYWFESEVRVSPQSLKSGLVQVFTCHHALDPNHKIVINFNPQRVTRVEIAEAQGMAEARMDGLQVVLRDVKRGAKACINIESKALEAAGQGRWTLHAGPLMRRYIDGFLPMQAKLKVVWPTGLLRLAEVTPQAQSGVVVRSAPDQASMDATFAGTLRVQWLLTAADGVVASAARP
jgi:hypothetical protein